MASDWFKFPASFVDDARFRGLNPSASLTYLRLFCLASRGFWDLPRHDPDTMVWTLRLEGRERGGFKRDLAALMEAHLVDEQGKPVDFDSIQGSGVSVAERVRRCRERKRARNVTETLPSPLQSRDSNVTVTTRAREEQNRTEQNTPSPPEGVRGGGGLSDEDRDFEAFWAAYPRKTAKWDARKAWHAAVQRRGLSAPAAIAAVEAQARSDQWTRDGGRFVPSPAAWLSGGRWLDDVSAMADSENSKKGGAADVPDDPELAEKRALVAALGREEREDGL